MMCKKFFILVLFFLASCGEEDIEKHFDRNNVLQDYDPEGQWEKSKKINAGLPEKTSSYSEMNSALTKDFWNYMISFYGTTVSEKNTSRFMFVIGSFLSSLGILDREIFLNEYATTIRKTIYIPFKIGDTLSKKELLNQLLLCVHEHQHVVQYERFGKQYSIGYVLNHKKRARFETEAYSTSIEIYYWFFEEILDTQRLATMLESYDCDKEDIANSKRILDSNADLIKKGKVVSESGKTAIGWLNKNAKNLQVKKEKR
jgi:hypothetical protein